MTLRSRTVYLWGLFGTVVFVLFGLVTWMQADNKSGLILDVLEKKQGGSFVRCICSDDFGVRGGCTLVGGGQNVAVSVVGEAGESVRLGLYIASWDPQFPVLKEVASTCIPKIKFVHTTIEIIEVIPSTSTRATKATKDILRQFQQLKDPKRCEGVENRTLTIVTDRWNTRSLYHVLIGNTGVFQFYVTAQHILEEHLRDSSQVEREDMPLRLWIPKTFGPGVEEGLQRGNQGYDEYYDLVFPNVQFWHEDGKGDHEEAPPSNFRHPGTVCGPLFALGIWSEFELYHLNLRWDVSKFQRPPVHPYVKSWFRKFADRFLQRSIQIFGDVGVNASFPILLEDREVLGYDSQERARGVKLELRMPLVNRLRQRCTKCDDSCRLAAEDSPACLVVEKFSLRRTLREQFHSIRSRELLLAGEGAFFALMLWAREESTWLLVYQHRRPRLEWKHRFFHEAVAEALDRVLFIVYDVANERLPSLSKLDEALRRKPGNETVNVFVVTDEGFIGNWDVLCFCLLLLLLFCNYLWARTKNQRRIGFGFRRHFSPLSRVS
jgi:hypothetical protein